MMCEPLKGKIEFAGITTDKPFAFGDDAVVPLGALTSSVIGIIEYHESNIREIDRIYRKSRLGETKYEQNLINKNYVILLKHEIRAIMAIEHWLEDAIDKREGDGCNDS